MLKYNDFERIIFIVYKYVLQKYLKNRLFWLNRHNKSNKKINLIISILQLVVNDGELSKGI